MPATPVAASKHIAAFGARLKSLRLEAGLTSKEPAEKCSISFFHLNQIEHCASGPCSGAIHVMSAVLEASLLFLSLVQEISQQRPYDALC